MTYLSVPISFSMCNLDWQVEPLDAPRSSTRSISFSAPTPFFGSAADMASARMRTATSLMGKSRAAARWERRHFLQDVWSEPNQLHDLAHPFQP